MITVYAYFEPVLPCMPLESNEIMNSGVTAAIIEEVKDKFYDDLEKYRTHKTTRTPYQFQSFPVITEWHTCQAIMKMPGFCRWRTVGGQDWDWRYHFRTLYV